MSRITLVPPQRGHPAKTETHHRTSNLLFTHLSKILVVIGCLGVVSTLLVVAYYRWTFQGALSSNPETWAQFGDYFGGTLNPVLAFLGLLALLLTLWAQSHELELSREELKMSREQLQRTAEAQEKAEKAITKQASLQEASLDASIVQSKLTVHMAQLEVEKMRGTGLPSEIRHTSAKAMDKIANKMGHLVSEFETDVTETDSGGS